MKRPILILTLGFIAGIIGGLYLNIVLFILVGILVCLLQYIIRAKIRLLKILITKEAIILFYISLLIGNIYVAHLENSYKKVYNSLEEVEIIGTIISEKEEKEYNDVYKIKVEKINEKKVKNKNFLLSIKKDKSKAPIKYGDKIYTQGEYIKPEEKRNYRGFDYSRYLKTINIYGTIKVKNKLEIIKPNNLNCISLFSNSLRNKIVDNVNKMFQEEETKGIFLGILLGYTDFISEDVRQNFIDSSLSHLLAVSGAHVSYVILELTLFFKLIKIPKKLNKILNCIFLIFYLYIINFTASVTRAVVMSIISIMQFVLYRKQDTATTISFSSLFILLQNPYKILNIGFLLSYSGTIGIILFVDKLLTSKEENKSAKIIVILRNLCIVTISAQILILPIMIYCFNTISFTFIVSNLIAGVLMGPITIIGLVVIICSLFSLSFSSLIAKFYQILLLLLLNTTKAISSIPISKIYVKTPHIIVIILYYLFVLFLFIILILKQSDRILLKRKTEKLITKVKCTLRKNKIKVVVILLLILILFCIFSKVPRNLKVYFIDVGQGDSCLIVTPMNKKILIDSGGNENYDVGKNILFPYLLDRGITRIDYVVISHFDTDHCKGFEYVLENMKVNNIIISKQIEITENFKTIKQIAERKDINIMVVSKGNVIHLDKYSKLEVFSPESKTKSQDINDNSIVAKFTSYHFSILFTGDASQSIEKELTAKKGINLKSTVLKVSHHGSKTGTSEEFLEKVKPKFALIGVGKNNKFGHPSQEVIERIQKHHAIIYRTDEMGEIDLTVNRKGKIKIKSIISD